MNVESFLEAMESAVGMDIHELDAVRGGLEAEVVIDFPAHSGRWAVEEVRREADRIVIAAYWKPTDDTPAQIRRRDIRDPRGHLSECGYLAELEREPLTRNAGLGYISELCTCTSYVD